ADEPSEQSRNDRAEQRQSDGRDFHAFPCPLLQDPVRTATCNRLSFEARLRRAPQDEAVFFINCPALPSFAFPRLRAPFASPRRHPEVRGDSRASKERTRFAQDEGQASKERTRFCSGHERTQIF